MNLAYVGIEIGDYVNYFVSDSVWDSVKRSIQEYMWGFLGS
jgi:hypothetical protein